METIARIAMDCFLKKLSGLPKYIEADDTWNHLGKCTMDRAGHTFVWSYIALCTGFLAAAAAWGG